jgi:hypothetical protein
MRAVCLTMLTTLLLGGSALAQDYDNPTMGASPCIVLNDYRVRTVERGSESPLYRARATIENICGRTMDVAFCFVQAEPVDDQDRSCYGAALRPGSVAQVENPGVPVRITNPEISWRYLE